MVVYEVQEEVDAVLTQRTMQLDAVFVIEHAELELVIDSDERCDVNRWLFVG